MSTEQRSGPPPDPAIPAAPSPLGDDAALDYLEQALFSAFKPDGPRDPEPTPTPTPGGGGRVPEAEIRIPAAIDRFRVEALVGRGGSGVVLSAKDPVLDRHVAVKLLREDASGDPDAVSRFRMEARVAGRLQHPGVVPVHELGTTDGGRPYFTMKLVEGEMLATLLRLRSSPDDDRPRFLRIFEAICQTVGYAHARGVVHRDLKPSNVLIGAFGETLVTDWGAALVLDAPEPDGAAEPPTTANAVRIIGTPAYMAPEQARGDVAKIGRRSDVFALGAILCEILTGDPPFRGDSSSEVLLAASRGWTDDALRRIDASGTDADLVELAKRCLEVEASRRPTDAAEVAREVERHLRSVEDRARALELEVAAERSRAAAERRLRRTGFALAGVILVAIVTAGALYLRSERIEAKRLRDEERYVDEVGERVRALVENADTLTQPDPAAFVQPVTVIEDALAAARGRDFDRGVQARLDELRRDVLARQAGAAVDHRIVDDLVAIREHFGDPHDQRKRPGRFASVFERAGISIRDQDAKSLAASLRGHRLHAHLVAGLDDWATSERLAGQRSTADLLVLAANEADDDPFRKSVRTMVMAGDRSALRALAQSPPTSDASIEGLLLLATALRTEPDVVLAIAVLEAAAARFPDAHDVHHELGTILRRDPKSLDRAIRHFGMALALRPTSAHAYLDLGHALLAANDLDEAARYLDEADRQRPDYAPTLQYRAMIALKREDLDTAERLLRRSVELDPDVPQGAARLVRLLLDAGRLQEAETLARDLERRAPDSFEPKILLASLLDDPRHDEEVLRSLRNLVERFPASGRAWYLLGLRLDLTEAGDPEPAFRRALRESPQNAEILCDLGNFLIRHGRFDEAVLVLRQGHALGTLLGPDWTFPSSRWVAEAERIAELAPLLDTSGEMHLADLSPRDLALLARAALARKDPLRAIRIAESAIDLEPSSLRLVRPLLIEASLRLALGLCPAPLSDADRQDWLATAASRLDDELADLELLLTRLPRTGSDPVRHRIEVATHSRLLSRIPASPLFSTLDAESRASWPPLLARLASLRSRLRGS